jgi:hypothetical protein
MTESGKRERTKSPSAIRRFEKAHRGTLHEGKRGDTIEMSDRVYLVAKDGSLRLSHMKKTGRPA